MKPKGCPKARSASANQPDGAALAGQPGRPTGPCFERRFDLNALFSDPIPPVVGAAEKDDKKSAVVSDIATRRGGKQMPAIAMSMGAACCRG